MKMPYAVYRSTHTLRAYQLKWNDFVYWCGEQDYDYKAGDPKVILEYAAALMAGRYPTTTGHRLSLRTIQQWMSAISSAYHDQKLRSPFTRALHEDLRTLMQDYQWRAGGHAALTEDLVRKLLKTCRHRQLVDIRDRAIILVSRYASLRRNDIVRLDMADVEVGEDRYTIHLSATPRTLVARTDEELCPVLGLRQWIAKAGIQFGRIFRPIDQTGQVDNEGIKSTTTVWNVIRERLERARLDVRKYSHNSLRHGLWVDLGRAGVSVRDIAATVGVDLDDIERILRRHGIPFDENVARYA